MDKQKKNLVVFGYGLAVIIFFFVWRHSIKHEISIISYIFLAFAGICTLITTINYQWLKPIYKKWMVGAHFIGTIITTVILSLLYFVIFGISGMVLRIIRKDLLDRTWKPPKESYWIKREGHEFKKEDCLHQF